MTPGELRSFAADAVALSKEHADRADAAEALLAEAEAALTVCWRRALTLKPMLEAPYPDAPETSPWAKFMEPAARSAHDLSMKIRKHLRESVGAGT